MHRPVIAGDPEAAMFSLLSDAAYALPVLVNADPVPDSATIIARSKAFAAGRTESAIITLLPDAAAGLARVAAYGEAAILWAFTRQAAMDWASRKIRVNAIGLGATKMRANPVTPDDIARTVRAIAEFPSMTGQLIRLGF